MASTLAGKRITEAHRLAQIALSKTTVRDFLAVWRLLDQEALAASFPAYARAARLVIDANRAKSSALSLAYLDAFRRAEGVKTPLDLARDPGLPEAQATTSLTVTGPVTVYKGLRAGKTPDQAMNAALVLSGQAVLRHALNGGRATIAASLARDPEVRGVVRVTDGKPCAFCAWLAARGIVHVRDVGEVSKSHDGCGCTAEPVYGDPAVYTPPGRSSEFAELASRTEITDEDRKTRDPAQNAFRRLYEGR